MGEKIQEQFWPGTKREPIGRDSGYYAMQTCATPNMVLFDPKGHIVIGSNEGYRHFSYLGHDLIAAEKLVGTYRIGWLSHLQGEEAPPAPTFLPGAISGIYRQGLYNLKTRKWVIDADKSIYKMILPFCNGFADVCYKNSLGEEVWGFMKSDGCLFSGGYSLTECFSEEGVAAFERDGKTGILYSTGEEKILKNNHHLEFLHFHKWNNKLCSVASFKDDDIAIPRYPWEEGSIKRIIDEDENILYTAKRDWSIIWDYEQQTFLLEGKEKIVI